jgi:monoamine oxidase
MRQNQSDPNLLDVAIVGGGVSGVYSGWRLLTSDRAPGSPLEGAQAAPLKVALFESSGRIGGRLLSVTPPGIPDTRLELGGMRYTSAHKWVVDLVDHLGLTPKPFPVRQPENIAYLRGHRLRMQDLTDADKLPYDLRANERNPVDLADGFTAVAARRTLQTILGKNVDLTRVDWLEVARTGRFEGVRLQDLALRYLMQRAISHEAFALTEDTSGYDSILFTWNGADGFPWNLADFGRDGTYHNLVEGYDQVPIRVAKAFQAAGGEIRLRTRLESFDQVTLDDGGRAIELRLADQANGTTMVRARHLILAMPRRSLELLDQTGVLLAPGNARVHDLIGSVTPIPLFKLGICYPYPWWETLPPVEVGGQPQPITQGESVTDLPIRQCYYWAAARATQNAVILIYDDGLALDYWAGLRQHPEVFENAAPPEDPTVSPEWESHSAPKPMVLEIHRQLLELHGAQDLLGVPEPYAAAYRDWGEDPYGGGANFWHLHVDSQAVGHAIIQPMPEVPVYVCGEAYSHAQGWVEGALATAEEMLQNHLGLLPPVWANRC